MKKVILTLDLHDDKDKQKAMKAVSSIPGIDSIAMNMKDKKMMVIGAVDPINIVSKLRKFWRTELFFVGPAKEPEKKEEPKKEEPKKEEPKKEEPKKEEPKKEEPKEEPKKQEPKKEEPKKEEGEKKKDPHEQFLLEMVKAYKAYNPPMTTAYNHPMPAAYNHPMPTHYYVPSAEENPNSCLIL